MPDALFERDGARFVPSELCRGPWSPEAQHGGPPAALLARAAEPLPPWGDGIVRPAFHADAVEHRFVVGGFDRPGPATDWIRLRVPLVAGEPTSPLCRVAAAADFGNGISWVLSRLEGYTFINPDLTICLHRMPAGEWVCLEAATWPSFDGIGLCESLLWDERGLIGRALQSLLLGRQ